MLVENPAIFTRDLILLVPSIFHTSTKSKH